MVDGCVDILMREKYLKQGGYYFLVQSGARLLHKHRLYHWMPFQRNSLVTGRGDLRYTVFFSHLAGCAKLCNTCTKWGGAEGRTRASPARSIRMRGSSSTSTNALACARVTTGGAASSSGTNRSAPHTPWLRNMESSSLNVKIWGAARVRRQICVDMHQDICQRVQLAHN